MTIGPVATVLTCCANVGSTKPKIIRIASIAARLVFTFSRNSARIPATAEGKRHSGLRAIEEAEEKDNKFAKTARQKKRGDLVVMGTSLKQRRGQLVREERGGHGAALWLALRTLARCLAVVNVHDFACKCSKIIAPHNCNQTLSACNGSRRLRLRG